MARIAEVTVYVRYEDSDELFTAIDAIRFLPAVTETDFVDSYEE